MTSREAITIRASASLKMILCLLSDPSSLSSRASNKVQSRYMYMYLSVSEEMLC